MTLTDELNILDDKIKVNRAQYDLSREAAKISALSSKDILEKYEYLTGEDLGHKPSVFEKAKFEYSPLGMVLTKNTKNKTNKNRVDSKKKKKTNIWYMIHNIVFQGLKISMNLENYHMILCTKDWMNFRRDLMSLKLLIRKQITIKTKFKTVLEIFLINCITFTRINAVKKKMV